MFTVTIDAATPTSCGTFRSRDEAMPTVRGLINDYYDVGCAVVLDGLDWSVEAAGYHVATIRIVPINTIVCKEVS